MSHCVKELFFDSHVRCESWHEDIDNYHPKVSEPYAHCPNQIRTMVPLPGGLSSASQKPVQVRIDVGDVHRGPKLDSSSSESMLCAPSMTCARLNDGLQGTEARRLWTEKLR